MFWHLITYPMNDDMGVNLITIYISFFKVLNPFSCLNR